MPKLCREVLWLALGRSDGKLAAGQTVTVRTEMIKL